MKIRSVFSRLTSRLFVKIFLSFLLFLIVTEIAIFGFYILFSRSFFQSKIDRNNAIQLNLVKRLVINSVGVDPKFPLERNGSLQQEITDLSGILKARIWLTDLNDEVLVKSFREGIPQQVIKKIRENGESENKWRYYRYRHHIDIYLTDTLAIPDFGQYKIHLLTVDKLPERHGLIFALGLLVIGLIIAVFVRPVSRHISNPIKALTLSAQKLQQGELSHRANIKVNDEIGELGLAFNRMAEKIEDMVKSGRELTAQVSHELRSPLARMRVAAELLLDVLSSESAQHIAYLNSILEEIEDLDQLIGKILALSKLDLDESTGNQERFTPDSVIKSLVGKFSPLIREKGLKISLALGFEKELQGNPESFKTALSNLFDNAIKYAPSNGSVQIASLEDDGFLLSITNSCDAIPDQDLEAIFRPFYRIHPDQTQGTGLGLAITRKIIEKSNGSIQAFSVNNEFTIRLRLPSADDESTS